MATNENINEIGIPVISFDVVDPQPVSLRANVQASQNVQTPVDKTLTVDEMAADAKVTGDWLRIHDEDIADIDSKTGEDIPLNSATGAPTIDDAYSAMSDSIAAIAGLVYPIGSIYQTTADSLPEYISAIGTWEEILIPLSWNDIKHGSRQYVIAQTGDSSGTVRMWRRTA